MAVSRRPRDKLTVGTVLAQRTDRSRLAVVASLSTAVPSACVAGILTASGKVQRMPCPYGYLPRWSDYLRQPVTLEPQQPLLPQLRALVAQRRRDAEELAAGATISRYQAAALAQMRVQGVDYHRAAGAFEWAKHGREVLIDRASFVRWLESRESGEVQDVAEAQ